MNVLAIMPWYPANGARFLVDGFVHSGHNVFRYGPTYFDHYGLQYDLGELPEVDCEIPRIVGWNLNEALDLAQRQGFTTDLIILSEENYQNQIEPTSKVPVVLWSADGWPNCYERRKMIQPTLAYTNHPLGVNPHPRTTIPDGWKFLPGAADSKWHARIEGKKMADFCLLATAYGKRREICQELRGAGLAVVDGQATPTEYQRFCSASLATYHNSNGQAEVKWRMFEHAAMGCINICDDNYLMDALGFYPHRHYLPIEDFYPVFDDDLWPCSRSINRAISRLKNSPDWAAWISEQARYKILSYHLYENRAGVILNDLGLAELNAGDIDCDRMLRNHMSVHPYSHRNLKMP